jgi:predicted glycosyltransferase
MSTGAWDRLHEVYDGVIVYGDPVVRTTALEMDLAGRLPIPVEHVGFVAPPPTERLHRGCRRPTIVVTAGGGGDGLPLLEAYTEFLTRSSLRADVRSVLVTGPLSDADPASDLLARVSGAPVEILRFSDRMEPLLATADAAITMAGYNTVAELLAFEIPAVLIPRTFPRVEQWLRATRISAVADFVPVAADEITVEHVDALVRDVLERRAVRRHQLDLDGARATARALVRVCRTRFAQVV